MDDRKRVKEEIKAKMEKHGISPDELKPESEKIQKEGPTPKKQRPARKRQRPQRRQSMKNSNANSETKITTGGFFGSAPILGGHRRGIFDDKRPIVGRTKRITERPVLSEDKRPIVGDKGKSVSQGSIIGNRRVIGDGVEISRKIRGRRR